MWECARRVYVQLKQYGRLLCKSRGHAVYTIESSIALVPLLGDKWHMRDLNERPNFCYFNQKTSVSPAQEPENWTLGSSTNKCIHTVTAHYITSEWEMKHHCLQTCEVDERLTAEKEWGLQCKAYGCTTDNASNITNAVVNHFQLVYLPCIGHTLQLSVVSK